MSIFADSPDSVTGKLAGYKHNLESYIEVLVFELARFRPLNIKFSFISLVVFYFKFHLKRRIVYWVTSESKQSCTA